jgi:opacity protein-like surface antigen
MNLYNQTILAGIGSEYLSKQNDDLPIRVLRNDVIRTIEVIDGFELIPIEITGYYVFPFSGSSFIMVMGGGIGAYIGRHIRKIGTISVSPIGNKTTFGFHVMAGAEYFIHDFISVKYEMKFRDPDFEIKSKYSPTETILNRDRIQVLNTEFNSRINIDGINFILGLAVHF